MVFCEVCGRSGHAGKSCGKRCMHSCAQLHAESDCPLRRIHCSLCQKDGHEKAKCPLKLKCTVCSEKGHLARECPQNSDASKRAKSQACRFCNQEGHFAADCQARCRAGCRAVHTSSDCPIECRRCKITGHVAKDCNLPDPRLNRQNKSGRNSYVCNVCGSSEHEAFKCPSRCRAGCKPFHPAEDCKSQCPLCRETGHSAIFCPRRCQACPRKEDDGVKPPEPHLAVLCPISCDYCGEPGHRQTKCQMRRQTGGITLGNYFKN